METIINIVEAICLAGMWFCIGYFRGHNDACRAYRVGKYYPTPSKGE